MNSVAQEIYTAAVIGVGKAGGGGPKGGGHAIGHCHAQTFQSVERVKLRAGADINAENLNHFQEVFDLSHGYEDYRTMLKELKPDLVSIGTYVGLHRQIIVDAARAGVKGIICEKPFLNSPKDIQIVREVIEETGVKIVVGHMRRYNPTFERVRELFDTGAVGRPVMCVAGLPDWDLSEWGAHWIDIIRYFNNDRPVSWVFGQLRERGFRGYGHAMEEHGVAYFEFDNGVKGLVDAGKGVDGWTLILTGTEGLIRTTESQLTLINAEGQKIEEFGQHPNISKVWTRLLEDLLSWIEGGPEPRVGHASMLKTCELNLAAYLSALKGDRIDLPLSGDLAEYDEWPVEAIARGNRQDGS